MSEALVILQRFSPAFEAHIAKGKLESEGITAVLDGLNMNRLYTAAVSEITLSVYERDAERAMKILRKAEFQVVDGSDDDASDEDDEDGSSNG